MINDRCISLSYLIIFRAEGGLEAEKAERERWLTKERKKLTDSVDCKLSYLYYYFSNLNWFIYQILNL